MLNLSTISIKVGNVTMPRLVSREGPNTLKYLLKGFSAVFRNSDKLSDKKIWIIYYNNYFFQKNFIQDNYPISEISIE